MALTSDKKHIDSEEVSPAISEYEMRRNADEDRRENHKIWISAISSLGTICIPLVLLLANCTIQSESELRSTRQVALELQSQREQSEAQMKASMFGKLLDKYQSTEGLSNPSQKIFYLELLVANFGDSLNLTPIINDLSTSVREISVKTQDETQTGTTNDTIPKPLYDRLRNSISEAGTRQMSMLANVGAVLDIDAKQGDHITVLIQNCKEGDEIPISHYLTFTPGRVEIRNGEPAVYMQVTYWNSKWGLDNDNDSREPIRRDFFVESVDLPLIDNLPLREGVRLAIRSKKQPSFQGVNSFELVAFSQEYSSVRDKPTAREYVNFLTKSPIGKRLDKKTEKCFNKFAPIDVQKYAIREPTNDEDPKKTVAEYKEYKYFAKYVLSPK